MNFGLALSARCANVVPTPNPDSEEKLLTEIRDLLKQKA